ncbi:MAG: hypothetical protein L0332_21745 [Chloroflexi bacterium]|nr:hypothetical protein [Chloroflexota bacterium]MCI0729320.1 hypothetical protein [Chloroflexota bacterium]
MTHDDLVFEAVCYRRYVGADLRSIRAYISVRGDKRQPSKEDRAALDRLEVAGQLVRVGRNWFLSPNATKQARGPALAPEWKAEDAWMLLALLYNRENPSGRLENIIAMADFINHAIPTLEEMHGALNRLAAGGLITRRRDSFTVSEKAVELFSKVEATCKKRVLDQLDGLRRIMACPWCGVRLKSVRWRIHLDEATMEKACLTYHEMSGG